MTFLQLQGPSRKIWWGMLCALIGGVALVPAQAAGKGTVAYVPGVSVVPEVLLPDGVTPRTYNTTNGLSIWTNTLPVVQGDKVKVNVFAATGGADLKQIIVRLDNTRIASIAAAPWKTVLDTTKMATGYHMIEVWAQGTGDHPQSTTKTLTFYVASQLASAYIPQPAAVKVSPSLQSLNNGHSSTLSVAGEGDTANEDTPPAPLSFMAGKATDSSAQVAVYARSSVSGDAAPGTGTLVSGATITINEPTLLEVRAAPSSTATQFAYALVRDGRVVYASPSAYTLSQFRVRVEKLTTAGTGLSAGTVALWVWGINASGQPSEPTKTLLNIP